MPQTKPPRGQLCQSIQPTIESEGESKAQSVRGACGGRGGRAATQTHACHAQNVRNYKLQGRGMPLSCPLPTNVHAVRYGCCSNCRRAYVQRLFSWISLDVFALARSAHKDMVLPPLHKLGTSRDCFWYIALIFPKIKKEWYLFCNDGGVCMRGTIFGV